MSFKKQAEFLCSIRQLVAWHNEQDNGPKIDLSYLIRILDEQIAECCDEGGVARPGDIDLEDWDRIPSALIALQNHMMEDDANHQENDEEEWRRFEMTPVTIGWGDHLAILPTCAATHNGIWYYIKDVLEEYES